MVSSAGSVSHAASVRRHFSVPSNYLAKTFTVRVRSDIVCGALAGLPQSEVLDVGCGDGNVSRPLLGQGHRVTFLDPSRAMLTLARINVPPEHRDSASFVEGTLDAVASDGRFGAVLCLGVLAYVASVPGTLDSLARVTAPGGQVVIQITDAASLVGRCNSRYQAWRERRFSARGFHLNEITLRELVRLASERGLELLRAARYSLLLPGMQRALPNWLLYRITALSRHRPLSAAGGDVIAFFRKR